jgi:hypothetical protein
MRTAIAAMLTLAAAISGRAGENLSAETLLPGHEATDAHAPASAFGPASPGDPAAAGKGVFLVVWEAGRGDKADIVGLRLDKSGKALDAKPLVISGARDCQEGPRVAFGDGVFLVTWQDLRNGKDWDIYAARVSPEGKVLDPDGIAVSAEKHNQCRPAVCFDGKVFQILWKDLRDGVDYDMFGGRVGADGRLMDGSGVLVQKRFQGYFLTKLGAPGVGSDGKGHVVAAAGGAIAGGSFWTMCDGKATGKPQQIAHNFWDPAFATDGQKLLAVFTTMRPVSRGGARPNSGAVLVDPASGKPGEIIKVSDKSEWASCIRNPSAAWDGKTYVVAWDVKTSSPPQARKPYDAVLLRRISAEGKPLGADSDVAGEHASPAYHPAVASDGAGTTLIAYEKHPETGDVPIKIAFRMLK